MFLKDYHREGKQPVAGVAQLIEDDTQSSGNESKGGEDSGKATMESTGREGSGKEDKKYKVKYEGLAAFKDERLVGYLDAVETRAYKILTNTIGNSVVSLTDGDHVTALHIDKSKASLSACAADKGKKKAKLDVKIKMDISVMQADENLDVTDFENLKALEDRFNKQIRDEVLRAIKKAQTEFKSDIFGFGNAMHADRPGEWKKFRANWDESFSDADINIRIQSSINRSGLIKKTIKNRA
jgi:spore germination protein KC